MEKEREEKVVVFQNVHEFYCDYCGEKVSESLECDDGYYYKPDSNMRSRSIRGHKFEATIDKCVCNDCSDKFETEQKEFYERLSKLLSNYGYSIIE